MSEPLPTAVAPAPSVSIRSHTFDPGQTATSVLCLEVGRDGFRFLVQNADRQGCFLEDYTFPSLLTERPLADVLPDLFREHPVLSAGPWQDIRIGVNSPSFTFVPETLFRKEYASSYLAFMRGSTLPAHEFAQAYAHPSDGFWSVFSLEHPLADFFSAAYPLQPLTFLHQTAALVQATAVLSQRMLSPYAIWLYFEDEFVTIVHRENQRLLYCNRFGYKNAQDLTYYVLYVLDEQKLTPNSVRLTLYGEITPFADTYAELNRFIPNLSFGPIPDGLTLTPAFDDMPEHRYLSLYGLTLFKE